MQVLSRPRVGSSVEKSGSWRAIGAAAMPGGWRDQRGFTLVELMITLAVAVVLIMIAVPSFRAITLSSKLTTTANDMVASLNVARMEAIKRNANIQFCSDLAANNTSDPLGTQCGTQAGAVVAATGPDVRAATVGLSSPLRLNGNIVAIRYGGQGLGHRVNSTNPYTGTVADICTSVVSSDNHRVISMVAGSIIQTTTSSGACP
ncbi:MAG: prepilin-type N-terminal cleavage/methylation domain-containing protein [Rhodanobacter sp.]|nr:MAG: prepilin-type N-terminal cleavage/methylation domain-containing protein [Rhodanobacter sp.]